MITHSTKFGIGDLVEALGIPGIITAVFIRQDGCSYQFSYVNEGNPTYCVCAEVELEFSSNRKVGFNKE